MPESIKDKTPGRFDSIYSGIKVLLAVAAAIFISSLDLDSLESFFYDARVVIRNFVGLANTKSPQSVLFLIDHETIERYKGFPNFTEHSRFLLKLKTYSPKFILYDFRVKDEDIQNIPGTLNDKLIFTKVAEQTSHLYFLTDEMEMKGEIGKLKLPPPFQYLNYGQAPKTSDTILFARDGVSRRFIISYQDNTLLHPKIAGWYNKEINDISTIKGQFSLYDTQQAYVNYFKPGSFTTYKFEDLLDDKIPKNSLENKTIIIGTATGKSAKEYVATPYSKEITSMTSVEYHAQVLQTLIENDAPFKMPHWFTIILTFIISFLTVYTVFKLRPAQGLIVLLMTLLLLSLVAILIFIFFNIWIDFAHPALTLFICYYFFIPYRLIKENRLSWEYYQRNKLLKQVEELKTNFISMMSHDLKTPIARIQGMTELIQSDSQPLSSHQQEALDNIKTSSDDLLGFINSILQYGRIESQNLELNIQSKDVNKVLEEVCKKHEFFAKVKKIKIIKNFEPLFPSKIDPDLMKQVFSNLLENAIKYSPENSTVWVESKEQEGHLHITFKDEGLGIPKEDLPNIFMKFYRSHQVKISNIKGSGLGLYLANYFTELNKGKIIVESHLGKGSLFTVILPID